MKGAVLFVLLSAWCAYSGEVVPENKAPAAKDPPPLKDAAAPAAAPVAPVLEPQWIKAETKHLALPAPRKVLSPGYFDSEIQGMIVFDKRSECEDIGLPRAKGQNKPLFAKMLQNFFWVDFNGDGKPGPGETSAIAKDGWSELFQYDASYDGGMTEPYLFRVHTVIEKEKYAIVRCCGRLGEIEGQKVLFLDDNGNGRYNDVAKDSLVIGDSPVTFLGKYILVGDNFYEILVQPSGTTFEYRAAPRLELGAVDLLDRYIPSQKSENLKIHTLIITGPNGSFSMNAKQRMLKIPAGAYDFVFGLFERAKETVYLKRGEKTTFSVLPGKLATPVWGGEIEGNFSVVTDGNDVVLNPPTFVGKMTERYFPENYDVIPMTGAISQVYEDTRKIEYKRSFASRRFELLPNGQPAPLIFKPYRNHADEYEATISYNSGIIGAVLTRQRMQYIPPSRPTKKSE